MEPTEIWAAVNARVRQQIADPTVWLALHAARPLLIDGSYFVAALPKQEEYLAVHLLNNQATTAIEEALHSTAGRILAFRLIIGESVADWNAEKGSGDAGDADAIDLGAGEFDDAFFADTFGEHAAPSASPSTAAGRPSPDASSREVSSTWEKLNERLAQGYKTAPFIKYPHGQAQYVLTAVKIISDTMDVQMPPVGAPRDDAQERALAKVIERFSSIVNLDPLFVSLELLRYRERHGKSIDIAL